MGAILRSVDASGASGVVRQARHSAPLDGATAKASAGAGQSRQDRHGREHLPGPSRSSKNSTFGLWDSIPRVREGTTRWITPSRRPWSWGRGFRAQKTRQRDLRSGRFGPDGGGRVQSERLGDGWRGPLRGCSPATQGV
jgi:hypothetical protein